ncbi:uncharacterized protein LOC129883665 [Solanum dulcamara]|uniref:uncharacterized protein LOC129883665 n=1 Tax=Solanum dulcamara TaxID=45834 RepID=UPI002484E50F|nr:uncharacterized protein LOC129883665 [Solanum dulcamara]
MGHIKKNCRVKQNQPQQHHAQQANFVEESEKEEESLFMASHKENTSNKSSWFIDSGCTSHMSQMSSCFTHLTSRSKLKLGWEMVKQSMHMERVQLPFKLHKGKHCLVFDSKDSLIVKVEMVDKSFPLDGKFDSANFASMDDSWLWHKRYGHFNYATLKSMYEKDLTKELPEISLSKEVCEACQMGKVHSKSFPKSATWRATEKLELGHTDVCGPMQTSSLG